MKIAHIVCTFPPYKGGIGNSAFNFAKILSELGHDVTVFTPDYGDDFDDQEKLNFKIKRIKPLLKIGNGAVLLQLLWKLKNFDIIHIHYPFYGIHEITILGKIFFWRKPKLVIHYHMEPTASGARGVIFKFNQIFIAPVLFRIADAITCASIDYVAHFKLGKYYKMHKNKFKETYFGVDTNRFNINHDNNFQDTQIKTILFVGGLDKAHYFKGVDILLKAVSMLKNSNWSLQILGDGDLRPQYEKLVNKLGINNKVNFFGKVSDEKLPKYYKNCDVLVLPSINQGEAFGMVLLEAMASGKPVIASDLPGVRSVFENGKHGFLCKPKDVNDLKNKLERVLGDDNLARNAGENGRRLVKEKYTWEKVGERLDRIYKNL